MNSIGLSLSANTVKSLVYNSEYLYAPTLSGSTWRYLAICTTKSGYTSFICGTAVSGDRVAYTEDPYASICVRIV